ncbi:hypothetical protein PARPLA_00887 [Rhodobacteraceae bacterium THAF1]|nr:hypothetical protein FIU81_00590 [Palleronia sp. THAF1]VDC19997.1 hypothetical protein PARPLA_00887 [Rhodobacteraceae bacterium THAF1]
MSLPTEVMLPSGSIHERPISIGQLLGASEDASKSMKMIMGKPYVNEIGEVARRLEQQRDECRRADRRAIRSGGGGMAPLKNGARMARSAELFPVDQIEGQSDCFREILHIQSGL